MQDEHSFTRRSVADLRLSVGTALDLANQSRGECSASSGAFFLA
ncbi:MAG TPA: hypothetical protein VIZ22_10425 [Candidatus Limnocylindrales bacterium]